jgi:hypothetical protein
VRISSNQNSCPAVLVHRICYGSRRILRRRSEGAVARSSAVSQAVEPGRLLIDLQLRTEKLRASPSLKNLDLVAPWISPKHSLLRSTPQHSAARRRGRLPPHPPHSSKVIPAAAARPRYAPTSTPRRQPQPSCDRHDSFPDSLNLSSSRRFMSLIAPNIRVPSGWQR